jgi:hypothetical protein
MTVYGGMIHSSIHLLLLYGSSLVGVCTTGAGFSGFWYHLGLWQSIRSTTTSSSSTPTSTSSLQDFEYYCYSSGCLSIVLALLGISIEETYTVCRTIQEEWIQGSLARYEILDAFLDRLLPTDDEEEDLYATVLPHVHIISTTVGETKPLTWGMSITTVFTPHTQQPTNRTELIMLLHRTARIPFLTGNGWVEHDNHRYIDGMSVFC